MARKTREEAARTRESLLRKAVELFYVKGVDQVSLTEIGREAGFTKGALYRHFGSKAGLLLELMNYAVALVENLEADILSSPLPPLERLKLMAMEEIRVFNGNSEIQGLLSLFLDRRTLAEDGGILASIEAMRTRTLSRIEAVLSEAVVLGEVSDVVDLSAAAETLRLIVFGLMERRLYTTGDLPMDSMAESMLGLFFRGLAP